MAGITAPQGAQQHTVVFVQPQAENQWEVVVEGRSKTVRFSDRERALSYAQIWAAVNRPCTVFAYGEAGRIQGEWNFEATSHQRTQGVLRSGGR